MQKLQTVLQAIASELPGFSAAGIVLIEDGITVAALGKGPETDPSAIAAYLTGIVQSKIKAAPFVGEQPSIEDILIARDDRYYFIRLAPKRPYFIFIMAERNEWPGKIRLVVEAYQQSIADKMR